MILSILPSLSALVGIAVLIAVAWWQNGKINRLEKKLLEHIRDGHE